MAAGVSASARPCCRVGGDPRHLGVSEDGRIEVNCTCPGVRGRGRPAARWRSCCSRRRKEASVWQRPSRTPISRISARVKALETGLDGGADGVDPGCQKRRDAGKLLQEGILLIPGAGGHGRGIVRRAGPPADLAERRTPVLSISSK
ncbi:MAG: hypothetical protein ACLTYN_04670 [Dysosmobacter welbionis]